MSARTAVRRALKISAVGDWRMRERNVLGACACGCCPSPADSPGPGAACGSAWPNAGPGPTRLPPRLSACRPSRLANQPESPEPPGRSKHPGPWNPAQPTRQRINPSRTSRPADHGRERSRLARTRAVKGPAQWGPLLSDRQAAVPCQARSRALSSMTIPNAPPVHEKVPPHVKLLSSRQL